MFKNRYFVQWKYSENGRIFKSKLFDSYDEAVEFIKKYIHNLNYSIEEILFEA